MSYYVALNSIEYKRKRSVTCCKVLAHTHTHTRVTLLEFDPGKNVKKKVSVFFGEKAGRGL